MALPDEAAAKIQCNTPEAHSRIWRVETPQRLELFLLSNLPNASRESIRRALAIGACRVDSTIRHLGYRLRPGMEVVLEPGVRISEVLPEAIPLPVIYDDEELIAIDKPPGMLVHPTTFERFGTVANALRGMGLWDAHILHRIDRLTSGVLLIAKALPPRSPLSRIFAGREVEKRYLAVVDGPVDWEERVVNLPIGRDPNRHPQWDVSDGGASAETKLRVLIREAGRVVLEAEPVTGRTNQIRIHCAAIGHPVCGDPIFRGSASSRLLLHAWKLAWRSRPRGPLVLTAPPPPEFPSFTADR